MLTANRTIIRMTLAALLLAAVQSPADETPTQPAPQAPELTVDQIVQRANYMAYYQGRDGRATVNMTIVDSQNRKRERQMVILRKDTPADAAQAGEDPTDVAAATGELFTGPQKFYVYFLQPADVNRMVFMVHKYMDRDDDRWLYLPNLDLVKRISAGDKRTSFVGSHFYYEDVSGRNVNDDVHELVETTEHYYVLKNTPRDPRSVEFAYFKTWIHRGSFLVVQNSYYDARGNEIRRYQAGKVEQVDGRHTVTMSTMRDMRDNSYTTLEYSQVKYDAGIDESIFTERYLRRPPSEHIDQRRQQDAK